MKTDNVTSALQVTWITNKEDGSLIDTKFMHFDGGVLIGFDENESTVAAHGNINPHISICRSS